MRPLQRCCAPLAKNAPIRCSKTLRPLGSTTAAAATAFVRVAKTRVRLCARASVARVENRLPARLILACVRLCVRKTCTYCLPVCMSVCPFGCLSVCALAAATALHATKLKRSSRCRRKRLLCTHQSRCSEQWTVLVQCSSPLSVGGDSAAESVHESCALAYKHIHTRKCM